LYPLHTRAPGKSNRRIEVCDHKCCDRGSDLLDILPLNVGSGTGVL